MVSAGVDMGSKTTKVVLMKDRKILSKSLVLTGFNQSEAAQKAFDEALGKAGITANDIKGIVVTGTGRKASPFKGTEITEVGADAKGVAYLVPTAKTVIDVGAEEGRGIRCSPDGKVVDFAVNEKCAAGAGTFTEAMSRALEVQVEDIGPLSLKSTKAVAMNAECAVFAESEVVSLIHAKNEKADIAKAIHDAIASRISSMVRKVGFEKDIVLIGGVARNPGFVESLKKSLESDIVVPEDPDYIGALGAAIAASERR